MEITVSRQDLVKKAATATQSVVERKTTIPIFNFLVARGTTTG